tara:strand:+ start:34 stop:336 length:303 start_codon:yes stop_codon:yes gene_type:complete
MSGLVVTGRRPGPETELKAADTYQVAIPELHFGNGLIVYVGVIRALEVFDIEAAILSKNPCVLPGGCRVSKYDAAGRNSTKHHHFRQRVDMAWIRPLCHL